MRVCPVFAAERRPPRAWSDQPQHRAASSGVVARLLLSVVHRACRDAEREAWPSNWRQITELLNTCVDVLTFWLCCYAFLITCGFSACFTLDVNCCGKMYIKTCVVHAWNEFGMRVEWNAIYFTGVHLYACFWVCECLQLWIGGVRVTWRASYVKPSFQFCQQRTYSSILFSRPGLFILHTCSVWSVDPDRSSDMAYVIWRVFMKKYSKIRLGIQRHVPVSFFPNINIILNIHALFVDVLYACKVVFNGHTDRLGRG